MNSARQAAAALGVFAALLAAGEFAARRLDPHANFRGLMNSRGLRAREFDWARSPGAARILFVGGSTTSGVAGPPEEAWPHLAGVRLAAALGRPVEAVNAAQPGRRMDWLAPRLDALAGLRPDLVVVMLGDNDCSAIYLDYDEASPWEARFGLRSRAGYWLASRSALFSALRRRAALLVHGPRGEEYDDPLREPSRRARLDEAWLAGYPPRFEAALERGLDAAGRLGAKVLLIEPPLSAKRERQRPSYARACARLAQSRASVARRRGVPLLRTTGFYAGLEPGFAASWDGVHFEPAAHERMAVLAADEIARRRRELLPEAGR